MSSNCAQYDERRLSHIECHLTASDDVDSSSHTDADDPSSDMALEQLPDAQPYNLQIRQHLEELNRFGTRINQLEKCLEEEKYNFQKVLNENSIQLKKTIKKCGEKNVSTSRAYYDAINKRKNLTIKCQLATMKFEKYNQIHIEARQAISDTELMFHKEMREDHKRDNFDQFWQEKLNAANLKFMEAKTKRKYYEDEHYSVMAEFRDLENKISIEFRKNKNSIKKAELYFDQANIFESKLKSIKEDIHKLEHELQESKNSYSQALRNLENISEEIHEKRAQILSKSLIREPGVGAELSAMCDENGGSSNNEANEISHLSDKLKQL